MNKDEFESVRVMRLEPGDRIVLRCKSRLHGEALVALKKILQKEFPDHRVIVLEAGDDIDVVRSCTVPTVGA